MTAPSSSLELDADVRPAFPSGQTRIRVTARIWRLGLDARPVELRVGHFPELARPVRRALRRRHRTHRPSAIDHLVFEGDHRRAFPKVGHGKTADRFERDRPVAVGLWACLLSVEECRQEK